MSPPIVAFDLETTGLDPNRDAIIEIGAVKFVDKKIIDEFSTLINPGRRIPREITQLTGITNSMVYQAPAIDEVLEELRLFVGNLPVLGHNIRFDLSFIQKQNIMLHNDPLDTYEMAAVLLPNAGRYRLGSLGEALGIPLPATHRALDDARVTHRVYIELLNNALTLPISVLAEIVRQSDKIPEWNGFGLFYDALSARSKETVGGKQTRIKASGPLFEKISDTAEAPLQPVIPPKPLDDDVVAGILEHGGEFSKYFQSYEYRPEQVEMLRNVTHALTDSQHLLIEAGTGIGKSFAYLIPAALWAIKNQTRVLISTNTINLQDQLITKDIPDLKDALKLDLRSVVLKGRNNYLCPRRLTGLRRRGPRTVEEMRILGKILVWVQDSSTGDRGEINLNGPAEREVWSRLSAADDSCSAEMCVKRTGGTCPFYLAKKSAQNAHLIIVNHALLLADMATGNRVLPEYDYVILDEAHHLEAATTNALSFRISQNDLVRILREIGNSKSGVISRILKLAEGILSPGDLAMVSRICEQSINISFQLESLYRNFFTTVDQFLYEIRDGRSMGTYAQQQRIVPSTRLQPAWMDVEVAWENTHNAQQSLLSHFENIIKILTGLIDSNYDELDAIEDIHGNISMIYFQLFEADKNLDALVFSPNPDMIYWTELKPTSRSVTMHAAPLHIGDLMEKHLWHQKESIILTSATLTTNGEFDYIRGRLNALDAYDLALGSPYDFENSSLLYLVDNIPEPGDRQGHQRAVEQSLLNLCKATDGRTLALFTSYSQLRQTSSRISGPLSDDGIQVYEQGEGASPHSLLENFRSSDKAVLLGTRSFWEGVDIPGDALSVLVIVKLPFDVPSDPIVSARAETFEDPFYQYAIPEAILRFRQGFGRLIRSHSDRGIVVVLDRRVLTKQYGRMFIDSLPNCSIKQGSIQNLPEEAIRWLNL